MVKEYPKAVYKNLFEMVQNDTSEGDVFDFDTVDEGNYTERKLIGQGAKKKVYQAFDTKCNRYVALAELYAGFSEEESDSFIREAKLTAALVHPNIISVYDIGFHADEQPYFTMELKVGKSLRDLVKSYSLLVTGDSAGDASNNKQLINDNSRKELLDVFLKVCDAVAFAHSQDLLHLDLKPDNIQVGEFGEVQVCDWGLGTIVAGNSSTGETSRTLDPDILNDKTLSGYIQGSPGYMAPEQISHEYSMSKQSDIYSLGILLYTVVAGVPPLKGMANEVIDETVNGSIFQSKCFRGFNSGIPKSLIAVIRKAAEFKPSERYQSVEELRTDINSYLELRLTSVESHSFTKHFLFFYQRNSVPCSLFVVFMMVVTILCSMFIYSLNLKMIQLAAEKDRAQNLLFLYEQEQQFTSDYFPKLERGLETDVYKLMQCDAFYSPTTVLKKAEGLLRKINLHDPAAKWSRRMLGYVHFLRQEFDQAEKYLSYEPKRNAKYLPLSRKYKELLTNDGLLSVEDFILLIDTMHPGKRTRMNAAVIMVKYDYDKRKSNHVHSKLLMHLLTKINPHWDGKLRYNSADKLLQITGRNLKSLEVDIVWHDSNGQKVKGLVSVISHLDVEKLVVGGTSIYKAKTLRLEGLKSIDIGDTPLTDLEGLNQIKSLREVIVNTDQFSDAELAILNTRIVIIKR